MKTLITIIGASAFVALYVGLEKYIELKRKERK